MFCFFRRTARHSVYVLCTETDNLLLNSYHLGQLRSPWTSTGPRRKLNRVLNEPDATKARQLRDDFRRAVHELIAPDSFTLEITHAVTKVRPLLTLPIGR
jgi:hypothetical protein